MSALAAVLARSQASLQAQSSREGELLLESVRGELAAIEVRLRSVKTGDAYTRLVRQRSRLQSSLAPLVGNKS